MDEKTEDLRDIFVEVSGTETVTESQTDPRGTLVDADERDVAADVADVVTEMRDRYGFETDLSVDAYVALVRAVHEGDDDAEIAANFGLDPETVFDARLDVHLLRESDTEAPFDLATLREAPDALDAIASDLGVDVDTVDRYRRAVAVRDEARAANDRYREAFEAILTDADLEGRYTDGVQDDGLGDAAEDIETNVSF